MRRLFYILLVFWLFIPQGRSQQRTIGFEIPEYQNSVTIPFKLVNNLIVIPVTINGRVTLDFIVDTGATTSILTDKVYSYLAGLTYDRVIKISGPGIIDSVTAYVCNDVRLSIPGAIGGELFSLLVLEEDYIKLSQNIGMDIHGIIGYDFFSRYPVRIDYDDNELTLYQTDYFLDKKFKKYRKLPLEIDKTKPYITSQIIHGDKKEVVKLMIDTGASHSLLIDLEQSTNITAPEQTIRTNLGYGLGGEIPGNIGRFDFFLLDKKHCLHEIIVSIPDPGRYSKAIKRGSRDGTIGGNTLKRFDVIFSYPTGDFLYRKSTLYKKKFEYDMSGMRFAFLTEPDRVIIRRIVEGSPAEEAGLEVGMIVKRVNTLSLQNRNISEVYSLLRKRPGKKIRVIVYEHQDGEKIRKKYVFKLRRLI